MHCSTHTESHHSQLNHSCRDMHVLHHSRGISHIIHSPLNHSFRDMHALHHSRGITSICCFTWFTNTRQLLHSSRKTSHNNYQDLYTLLVGTKHTVTPVGCPCRRFKMATRWGICSTGLIANVFCTALK